MKRTLLMTVILSLPLAVGCGLNLNQAFLLAGESAARTLLDVWISDLFSDLPLLFSLPPGPGEPVDGGDDNGDADGDGNGDGGGDAVAGAALFAGNSCVACHCDDASGGCLPGAPNIQGKDAATLQEQLQGDTPHTGGKFPDLTDQDIADLEAFLAAQGGA